ncbi:UDP-glycosyltransferase 71A15-like [Punica granatum]|uniref:UDP-glycosyltransferase 71A15-like n=1 Tax=Punica granatum TaxID=22663 RepID=A0A6P8EFZ4_PUNGR|nr:UDP-glycosyltransferase 71A15-like [Punica granatum]
MKDRVLLHWVCCFTSSPFVMSKAGICVNPVPAKVVPSVLLKRDWSNILLDQFRQFSETEGIVVNMFLVLESHAVSCVARDRNSEMYTVGPILDLKGDARVGSCGAQLHEDLIAWLDNQPMSSVMFPHGQLWGGPEREPGLWSKADANLYEYEISCSHRFLWSLRQPPPKGNMEDPSDYANLKHALPERFLDQTAPIRKVIGGPTGGSIGAPNSRRFVSH